MQIALSLSPRGIYIEAATAQTPIGKKVILSRGCSSRKHQNPTNNNRNASCLQQASCT